MQLDGELENDWNGPNAKATEKLLEHASANADHPIKKIPAVPHSVPGISTFREMGRKSNSKLGQIENYVIFIRNLPTSIWLNVKIKPQH